MLPLNMLGNLIDAVTIVVLSVWLTGDLTDREWKGVVSLGLRVVGPETAELAKLVATESARWVHRLHVRPLEVANDELIKASQLWHTLNEKLPVPLNLGAWISLQSEVPQLL